MTSLPLQAPRCTKACQPPHTPKPYSPAVSLMYNGAHGGSYVNTIVKLWESTTFCCFNAALNSDWDESWNEISDDEEEIQSDGDIETSTEVEIM